MLNQGATQGFARCAISLAAGFLIALSLTISTAAFGGGGATYAPDCNDPDAHDLNCTEPTAAVLQHARDLGYEYYVGHAEPTLEFFSTTGTSGNNMQWKFQLPATDPSPTQNGSSVANFELYSALWLGLELCDPNSNPYGPCVANSDSNNPATAGAAFLELQFYPPGSPFGGCSDTQWCVRLHINTLEDNNATQVNNCHEPTTEAYVTTDGTPGGTKLLMSNGDSIVVTIKDTANGLETDVNDLTSATTGSMVASGANGFVHNKNLTNCDTEAFDFHPTWATASPGQVVPWATLAPNVSFDFEIGHFELCGNSSCSTKPDGADGDDTNCGTVRGIGGCFASDTDQDGLPYQADWADGTAGHPGSVVIGSADDRGVGPLTTSTTATSDYDEGYPTIKFATTEGTATTFYPYYSQSGTGLSCRFHFGNLSGDTNTFGQAAQYGTTIDNPCEPGTPPDAKCIDKTVPTDPDLCSAAAVSIDNGSSDLTDGDPVTLSQSPPGPYAKGTTPVTLTVKEPENLSSTCMANVIVQDLQKPTISCPSPVAECTSPAGAIVTFSATFSDNCPGVTDACVPASGSQFALGSTPFTCTATDTSSNQNSCNSTVVVQDTTPPVISSVSASPNVLWPPNHKMVPVKVTIAATDTCDPNPVCKVISIASSEPPLGGGSGNTSPDFAITGPTSVSLRAERDGTGTGRTYTITVKCTDASNNSSQGTTTVSVPHNQ